MINDIRYFTDLIKGSVEIRELYEALDYLIKNGTGEPELTPLEEFKNLEKLPELVEALWYKLTQSSDLAIRTRNFFQICIVISLKKIIKDENPSEYLKVLMNLFSPKPFQRGGEYRYNQEFNSDLPIKISSQLAATFSQQDGLLILKEKIKNHKGSFDYLKKLLNTMKKFTKRVSIDEPDGEVEEFIKLVVNRILSTPDEEFKNESKKDLDFCVKYLNSIVSNITENTFTMAIQLYSMEIALKCFKSVSLEKRNAGLNDIIRFTKFDGYHAYNRQYCSPEKVVEWIKDHKIVELLFGETMHIQLLQKCTDILKFLAEKKAFQRKYLDLMWSAAEGKHETIENVIYETIGNIAPFLPASDIEYLFNKIKEIPLEHYTVQTLQLISCLTQTRIQTSTGNIINIEDREQTVIRGLEIFWSLLQDNNNSNNNNNNNSKNDGDKEMTTDDNNNNINNNNREEDQTVISTELAHQALVHLQDALYFHQTPRSDYLNKCMDNIANHNSVIYSLRLIKYIITTFTERQKKNQNSHEGSSAIIEHINRQMHLIDKFFAHLEFYKQHCKAVLANDKMDVDDISDMILHGRHTHAEQMHEFLGFICFIWVKSDIMPTNLNIDVLWHVYVVDPISIIDRDFFFSWVEGGLCSQEHHFSHILEKFNEISFTDLEPSGATLYINCMKNVNRDRQTNFVGVENAWRIILEAENEEVGKELNSFIIEWYKYMEIIGKKEGVEFLTTCLSNLQNIPTNQTVLNKSDRTVVNRTLALIQTYLEGFGSRIKDSFKKNFSPSITVNFNNQKHRIQLQIRSNETIGHIKSRLAKQINVHPGTLYLIHNTKVLQYDYETLEDYRVANHDTILFNELPEPRIQDDVQSITINFDQSKFGLLFSLLSIEEIAPTVWDVLVLLPVNRQIYDLLANIPSESEVNHPPPNWEQLLDHSSVFKLLYSLLIIENFVQIEDNNYEWRNRFIATGGLSQLIKIMMQIDLQHESKGSKRKRCLSLLIKTIALLVVDYSNMTINLSSVSTKVIPNFTPAAFLNRVMDLAWNQAIPTVQTEEMILQHITDDGEVINSLLTLIQAMVSEASLLDQMFARKDFVNWLSLLILESSDCTIRDAVFNRVYSIIQANVKAHEFFLKKCLALLPVTVGSDKYSFSCNQFFQLLGFLVRDSCNGIAGYSVNNFDQLLPQLVSMIKQHPVVETTNYFQADYVLIGLFGLVRTLVSYSPKFKLEAGYEEGLINEIFHNCLFDIATADNHGPLCPPKCKNKDSRDACFALLLELASNCEENYRVLVSLLMEQNKPEEKRTLWNYLPTGNEKSTCGYVGLKNLGATCYINSLMQQLFMIPAFRYSIIQAQDNDPTNPESLLHQLKIIFANLQESEKRSHDPKDFCMSYKYEGQPLNPYVQMDVDEFFNMLFDRLENQLKGTKEEKLLNEFFGGASVNQFISQECPHVSEREEPFYTISVEVKNKRDILESLQLFVESETLDGDNKYFCSKCSQKVKCLMRRCVKDLPNTLIVHNKRFEFDLDLMRRTKLNDQLKFPMSLDMAPYTKEYLERKEAIENAKAKGLPIPDIPPLHPNSYYQYELSGILVHTGTAESGHYYSFIKEREPLIPGQPRRWVQFNDQLTEVFNPEDIPKACFGGYDHISMDQGKTNVRTTPRLNNAYMLFYERTNPETVPKPEYQNLSLSEASKLVPTEIFNSVWKKNMKFLNDKNIFDQNYFNFIWQIIRLDVGNNSPMIEEDDENHFDYSMMPIELGTRFIIETLSHSRERKTLGDFVAYICSLYANNVDACRWLLETMTNDPTWIRQNILVCLTTEPREALTKLLFQVIQTFIPFDRQYYFEIEKDPNSAVESPMDIIEIDDDENGSSKPSQQSSTQGSQSNGQAAIVDQENSYAIVGGRSKSYIVRFMDTYLDFIKEAPSFWRHFQQYFMFIRDFSLLGSDEKKYLLSRNVISRLIDFFMGEESPLSKTYPPQKRPKMGDKYNSPQHQSMMETVAILALAAHTKYSKQINNVIPTHNEKEPFDISEEDWYMLTNPHFIMKTIRENINPRSTSEIIQHVCFGDLELSKVLIQTIQSFDSKASLDALLPLITMEDCYYVERTDLAIRAYINLLDASKHRAFIPHIKYVIDQALSSPVIGDWFENNLDEWLIKWLVITESTEVRSDAFNLTAKLFGLSGQAQLDPEKIHQLFIFLLSNAKEVKSIVKQEKDIRGGRVEYYFRLLSLCIISNNEKKLFAQYLQPLVKMLHILITSNVPIERSRQEIIKFFATMMKDCPENIQLIIDDPIHNKIMDYFISISPKDEFKIFNQKSLPAFYQVIYYMTQQSPDFLQFVATHNNFTWALSYLYLECGDYVEVAQVLYQLTESIVQKLPQHTMRILHHCLNFVNFYLCLPNCISILNLLVNKKKEAALLFQFTQGNNNDRWIPIEVICKQLKTKSHLLNDSLGIKVIEFISKVLGLLRKEIPGNEVAGESSVPASQQINIWDVGYAPFKLIINYLFNVAEVNINYHNHIAKVFNQVACEYPEGIIIILSELFSKRNGPANFDIDSFAQLHQQQQQLQNPQQQITPLTPQQQQQLVLQQYESFYKLLLDTINLCSLNNPNQNAQQKAINLTFKIIKEMLSIGIDSGYQVLSNMVNKNSSQIKEEDKVGMMTYAVKNPRTMLNQEFFVIIKKFFSETERLLSSESNMIFAGLCRSLEDQISTSIASINSLGFPSSSGPAEVEIEIDQHLVELTHSLKSIEVLGGGGGLSAQYITPIYEILQAFSMKIDDDILSNKAKAFKTNLETLKISNSPRENNSKASKD